jgi:hypothetical protein
MHSIWRLSCMKAWRWLINKVETSGLACNKISCAWHKICSNSLVCSWAHRNVFGQVNTVLSSVFFLYLPFEVYPLQMNKCFQDFYISFYQLIVGNVETEQSRQFQKIVMVEVIHLAAADVQYLKVRNITQWSIP